MKEKELKNRTRAEKIALIRKNSPLVRKVNGAFEVDTRKPEFYAWLADKE